MACRPSRIGSTASGVILYESDRHITALRSAGSYTVCGVHRYTRTGFVPYSVPKSSRGSTRQLVMGVPSLRNPDVGSPSPPPPSNNPGHCSVQRHSNGRMRTTQSCHASFCTQYVCTLWAVNLGGDEVVARRRVQQLKPYHATLVCSNVRGIAKIAVGPSSCGATHYSVSIWPNNVSVEVYPSVVRASTDESRTLKFEQALMPTQKNKPVQLQHAEAIPSQTRGPGLAGPHRHSGSVWVR